MMNAPRLRAFALVTVVLGSGCALVLDLPSPTLNAGALSDAGEGGVPGDDGGATDGGSAEAGPTCDLDASENCGACGVDCSSGKCEKGVCLLASGYGGSDLRSPYGITVVGDDVYVAVFASNAVGIGRCSKRGCQSTGITPLVPYDDKTTDKQPTRLIDDDAGTLFWTSSRSSDYPSNGVYRTELDGSTTQLNAGNPEIYVNGIAIHGDDVLWTSDDKDGGAFVCKKAGCGGAPTRVDTGGDRGDGRDVLVTPNGVVWAMAGTSGSEIVYCSSATCPGGGTLLANGHSDLATDGKYVYFQTYEGSLARAQVDPPTTGRVVLVESAKLPTKPRSLLVVNGWLYWRCQGTAPDDGGPTTDGLIQKCALPDCATVIDVATGLASPRSLATDGKAIYWSNGGIADQVNGLGALYKKPL